MNWSAGGWELVGVLGEGVAERFGWKVKRGHKGNERFSSDCSS